MITIPGEAVLPNVCMRSLRDTEEVAINPAGKKKTESKGLWEERGHRQVGKWGWEDDLEPSIGELLQGPGPGEATYTLCSCLSMSVWCPGLLS